jgi:hypothetical protein
VLKKIASLRPIAQQASGSISGEAVKESEREVR